MPYLVARSQTLIRVTLSGTITGSDLRELVQAMLDAEAGLSHLPPRIVDFSAITEGTITAADMMGVAERRRRQALPNRIRTAVVAAKGVQLGFARMFQTLNDHPMITIRIFQSMEEAERWVGEETAVEPPSPPPHFSREVGK